MIEPFVSDSDFTLYLGGASEVLAELPSESVHCAATSPPFYALRDYGVEGQIGLEDTPEEWVTRLVKVFREVRRVLRSDGSLWIECGDSYNSGTSGSRKASTLEGSHGYWENPHIKHRVDVEGIKAKDLIGSPWLLAFALRADGWWLRQAIIWHKPNAMPESATDRCTTAHSYVFLLSKSARYWFDADAIAEPAEWARWGDQTTPKYEGTPTTTGWIKPKTKEELQRSGELRRGFRGEDDRDSIYVNKQDAAAAAAAAAGHHASERRYTGFNERWKQDGRKGNGKRERSEEMRGFDERLDRVDGLKNPRSVWTIPTRGYPDAHFATWPEALCERIIKAGCPEGGTVLDPFMGSGTTALVARKLGRKSIGIELNADYARLAADRLSQLSLLAEMSA